MQIAIVRLPLYLPYLLSLWICLTLYKSLPGKAVLPLYLLRLRWLLLLLTLNQLLDLHKHLTGFLVFRLQFI